MKRKKLQRLCRYNRATYPTIPPRVDYELTKLGRDLMVPLRSLYAWAVKHRPAMLAARTRFAVAMKALRETNVLSKLNTDDFDALFFPGGYGLLRDLASDSYTIRLIERFHRTEKPIAMGCHA